jgi:SAM-dependent methyltransferase
LSAPEGGERSSAVSGQSVAMAIHPAAHGFHAAAEDYERSRPDYPEDAGRWLAERLDLREGRTVVDIAAGTGKLTRVIFATGANVVAIEPVAGMRSRLAATLPGVELLNGVAEKLPLADASVDAATAGQAFHWFDGDRALTELHRVVRERGRLAVVYNSRPLEHPLHAALEAIVGPLRGDTPAHRRGQWLEAFARTRLWAAVAQLELPHVQLLDREGVVARVASTSFIAALPGAHRADVLNRVRAHFERHSEPIEVPYVCELYVWQRLP